MAASYILDGITLLLILICVIHGYRAGLVHSVFNLFTGVLSLFLAFKLYPLAAGLLRATPLYPFLQNTILSALGVDPNSPAQLPLSTLLAHTPLPDFITSALLANNNPDIYQMLGVNSVIEYVGGYCAYMIINGIAIVVTFIIIRALLAVVSALLRIVTRLPVIHTLNRLGGVVFGALEGLLLVWVLLLALTIPVLAHNTSALGTWLNGSTVTKFLFDNNILTQWMEKIFH